jgi:hypothetical protein
MKRYRRRVSCSWHLGFAKFCNVLQCFAMFCNVLLCFAMFCNVLQSFAMFCNVLKCFALFCNVLQCFAIFCNVLQCFAMFCNVFHHCVNSVGALVVRAIAQSTHRVAMAIFWRLFHNDGKISPAW